MVCYTIIHHPEPDCLSCSDTDTTQLIIMKNYNKFPGSLFNPSQRHLYIGELYHRTCLIITTSTYYIMYLLSFRPTNKYRLIILLFTFQTTVVWPVQFTECSVTRWGDIQSVCWAQLRLSRSKQFTIPPFRSFDLFGVSVYIYWQFDLLNPSKHGRDSVEGDGLGAGGSCC